VLAVKIKLDVSFAANAASTTKVLVVNTEQYAHDLHLNADKNDDKDTKKEFIRKNVYIPLISRWLSKFFHL
jgi:hypothetical protein